MFTFKEVLENFRREYSDDVLLRLLDDPFCAVPSTKPELLTLQGYLQQSETRLAMNLVILASQGEIAAAIAEEMQKQLNKHDEKLNLEGWSKIPLELTPIGWAAWCNAFHNSPFTELFLTDLRLNDTSNICWKYVCKLFSSPQLRKLFVGANNFCDLTIERLRPMYQAIATLQQLEELDLYGNYCGAMCAGHLDLLCSFIATSPAKTLDLGGGILFKFFKGPQTRIPALWHAVGALKRTSLNIEQNELGGLEDDSYLELCNGISNLKDMALNLHQNEFENMGLTRWEQLCVAIATSGLLSVRLEQENAFKDWQLEILVRALDRNFTLQNIDINSEYEGEVPPDFYEALQNIMRRNQSIRARFVAGATVGNNNPLIDYSVFAQNELNRGTQPATATQAQLETQFPSTHSVQSSRP